MSKVNTPDKKAEHERLVLDFVESMETWGIIGETDFETEGYIEDQLSQLELPALVMLTQLFESLDAMDPSTRKAQDHFLKMEAKERDTGMDTEELEEFDLEEDFDDDYMEIGDRVHFSLVDDDEQCGTISNIGDGGIIIEVENDSPGKGKSLVYVQDGNYWFEDESDFPDELKETYRASTVGELVCWFHKDHLLIGEVTQIGKDSKGKPDGNIQVKRRDNKQTTLVKAGDYFEWKDDMTTPSDIKRFMSEVDKRLPDNWSGEVQDKPNDKHDPSQWSEYSTQIKVWYSAERSRKEKCEKIEHPGWYPATFWSCNQGTKKVIARVHALGTGKSCTREFEYKDVKFDKDANKKSNTTKYSSTTKPSSSSYSSKPSCIAGVPKQNVLPDTQVMVKKLTTKV